MIKGANVHFMGSNGIILSQASDIPQAHNSFLNLWMSRATDRIICDEDLCLFLTQFEGADVKQDADAFVILHGVFVKQIQLQNVLEDKTKGLLVLYTEWSMACSIVCT